MIIDGEIYCDRCHKQERVCELRLTADKLLDPIDLCRECWQELKKFLNLE